MKIVESDFDSSVIEKLNQLDKCKVNSNSNYISYCNGEFVAKSMNDLNLSKVISMDEINELIKHIYKSEDNYISFYDNCKIDDGLVMATSKLLSGLKGSHIFETTSDILKIKTYSDFILLLCRNGYVFKVNRSDISKKTAKNIVDIIKANYIYDNFDVYDIVDIEYYSTGVLVATKLNGIYFISLEKEESSLLVKELYVNKIKVLSDRKTLFISKISDKNNIVLFDITTGNKKGIYNQLGIYNQTALDVAIDEDEFFVLGKTHEKDQAENLLHHWELDAAEIDYENTDKYISINPSDNMYRPKFIRLDEKNVFIIGIKEKNVFIWKYDRSHLNTTPTELIFDLENIKYDQLKDLAKINDRYYLTIDNRILVLDDNFDMIENYVLDKSDIKSTKITESGIYSVSSTECCVYYIPVKVYQNTVIANILNDEEPCNNIDILIKGGSTINITFVNNNTAQKVSPYFYVKMDGEYHIIKLLNVQTDSLSMQIEVTNSDKIDGVVIHKNTILYK